MNSKSFQWGYHLSFKGSLVAIRIDQLIEVRISVSHDSHHEIKVSSLMSQTLSAVQTLREKKKKKKKNHVHQNAKKKKRKRHTNINFISNFKFQILFLHKIIRFFFFFSKQLYFELVKVTSECLIQQIKNHIYHVIFPFSFSFYSKDLIFYKSKNNLIRVSVG